MRSCCRAVRERERGGQPATRLRCYVFTFPPVSTFIYFVKGLLFAPYHLEHFDKLFKHNLYFYINILKIKNMLVISIFYHSIQRKIKNFSIIFLTIFFPSHSNLQILEFLTLKFVYIYNKLSLNTSQIIGEYVFKI